jgi:hypothetical protein
MTRLSEIEPKVGSAEPTGRSGPCGNPDRKNYEPPQIESYGKLDEVILFGGSTQVDSGSGLGNQPVVPPAPR